MKSDSQRYTKHLSVEHYRNTPPLNKEHKTKYIYLNYKYLQIHHTENLHFFFLFRKPDTYLIGALCLVCDSDETWTTLPKAPFGGVVSKGDLGKDEAIFLLAAAENFIKNHGGKKIIIISPPEKYDIAANEVLKHCYVNKGYKIIKLQRNHFIPVTGKAFEAGIKKQEIRRLKKCHEAGLQVFQKNGIHAVHAFEAMKSMREDFGYNTSITVTEFKKLLEAFPEQIRLFTVYNKSELIAVSMTVCVNEMVMYSFLSGYEKDYRAFSPTLMLLKKAYEVCQNEQVQILDLGISIDHHGYEKPSLIRFKENLGAQECSKITWEKCLDIQTVT